jgi:hypothetical protein
MSNLLPPLPERHDAGHSHMRPRLPMFALMLAALLDACGGGESGSGMSANASAPQLPQGVQGQVVQSTPAPQEPFDIPATALWVGSYTAVYSETPNNGTTMFDGQEANSSTISLTISKEGVLIASETDTLYYLDNPYRPLGMTISANGGQFEFLYSSTDPLPATLTAGSSGPLGSGTYYAINTNNSIGFLTETYSVAAWNGPWTMLLTTSATGTLNGQMVDETIKYVLAGDGPIVSSLELTVDGTKLKFASACEGCWD